MKIYLASPYSHPDPEVMGIRFNAAVMAAGRVMKVGHTVFAPIAHSHAIGISLRTETDHAFWMAQDMPWLEASDQLWVLAIDGWRDSRGVHEEITRAEDLRIPVFFVAPWTVGLAPDGRVLQANPPDSVIEEWEDELEEQGEEWAAAMEDEDDVAEALGQFAKPTEEDDRAHEWGESSVPNLRPGQVVMLDGSLGELRTGPFAKLSDVLNRLFSPTNAGVNFGEHTKDTNPKDAVGSTKAPLHLVPATATALASLAHLDGALKYGPYNWRKAGVRSSIYVDAVRRHLDAWYNGEDNATDSGLCHLSHAIAGLNILVDARECGMLTDDRAPYAPMADVYDHVKTEVSRLKERRAA